MARSPREGKYADVWAKYGQKGFGIPTMAPHVGSYPLYPIGRAQFALVLIAGPAYDKKKGERAQIAKRALAAHPSLKSFWAERKKTIKARMNGKGKSRMAANPSRAEWNAQEVQDARKEWRQTHRTWAKMSKNLTPKQESTCWHQNHYKIKSDPLPWFKGALISWTTSDNFRAAYRGDGDKGVERLENRFVVYTGLTFPVGRPKRFGANKFQRLAVFSSRYEGLVEALRFLKEQKGAKLGTYIDPGYGSLQELGTTPEEALTNFLLMPDQTRWNDLPFYCLSDAHRKAVMEQVLSDVYGMTLKRVSRSNPKRKRKKEKRGFFGSQPGSSGWGMSDPDAAPTAYYRQRKTVIALLHTNRSGEGTEMVYRIPVDMTGVPKENERGYKTKLRQAIKAQIPELKTNQEVRDAGVAYMPVDTFRYMPDRFRYMQKSKSGWKGYTDPSDYIRDRLPGVTPTTSDAAVLAIRDALTQGSWDDHWSAPVSNYRKSSMSRRNPNNVEYVYALLQQSPPPTSAYRSRKSLQRYVISLLRRDGNKAFFRADPDMIESVETVVDDYMALPRLTDNPSGQKKILVRSFDPAELEQLVPVAEDALYGMGATDVKASKVRDIQGDHFAVLFTIEGLGTGRRFSSQQRRTFRRLVTAFLPNQVRAPSFQNAEGSGFEIPKGEPLPGMRDRGSVPDSKRTARSKARSKARRKLTRRPNPRR